MKKNILLPVLTSGVLFLGFFSMENNLLVNAQNCSAHCQGFVQGCEDGENDNSVHGGFKYHFNPKAVSQSYSSGYNKGYYFGYYGPYDYCNAKDDRNIGCMLTHWDITTQRPC
jgi:hypothetical protein